MPFTLDPELATAMAAIPRPAVAAIPRDVFELRASGELALRALRDATPPVPGVTTQAFRAVVGSGDDIPLVWYSRQERASQPLGPAVVYIHGGGMVMANVDIYDRIIASYVAATGVPMLAVDYRVAPEFPHPTPVEDCFIGLAWLHEHANELGVDPARIAVMGDSGGGGLAAGVAILARDRDVALARQILVYPMLDDRNTRPDPHIEPFAGWTYDANRMGWTALLGDAIGGPNVDPSAAPARLTRFDGLAPTYIEVGELDIFRDECVDYAGRLQRAGISTELHVHAGAPHGFELVAPMTSIAQRAKADRHRVLSSL